MTRLSEEFNKNEMLNMMQGIFTDIPNFAKRTQEVVSKYMPATENIKQNRKAIMDRVLKTVKDVLFLPDISRNAVQKGFNPVQKLN